MLSIAVTILFAVVSVTILRFVLSLAINKVYEDEFYFKEELSDAFKFLVIMGVIVLVGATFFAVFVTWVAPLLDTLG